MLVASSSRRLGLPGDCQGRHWPHGRAGIKGSGGDRPAEIWVSSLKKALRTKRARAWGMRRCGWRASRGRGERSHPANRRCPGRTSPLDFVSAGPLSRHPGLFLRVVSEIVPGRFSRHFPPCRFLPRGAFFCALHRRHTAKLGGTPIFADQTVCFRMTRIPPAEKRWGCKFE